MLRYKALSHGYFKEVPEMGQLKIPIQKRKKENTFNYLNLVSKNNK